MTIVLIGPWCAGKSTLGARFADVTGVPFVDLDDLTPAYGAEIGWSVEHLLQRNKDVGMLASEREWEDVRAHAVERVLADHSGSVIAFGASYTGFVDAQQEARVRTALNTSKALIALVTASLDSHQAELLHRERARITRGTRWVKDRTDFSSWTPSPLDREVAHFTILAQPSRDALESFLGEPHDVPGNQPTLFDSESLDA